MAASQRLLNALGFSLSSLSGTADYTWIPQADVRPFSPNSPHYAKCASTKNKALQKAIDEAWLYLGRPRPDILGKVVGR